MSDRCELDSGVGLEDDLSLIGSQLYPMLALHRHSGFIALAAKSDDDFRTTRSIRADHLEAMLPVIREELLKDAFFSVNGHFRHGGRNKNPHGPAASGTNTLRYLCACYADLDFYRQGLDFNSTYKIVMDHCEDGRLPSVSIVIRSGRGMWLMWLLHDAQNHDLAHTGAWADNPSDHLQLYAKIQRAIGDLLAPIGADAGARDAARYTRVPGSLHTEAEKPVRWSFHGEGNRYHSYTLKDLAKFFDIRPERLSAVERRVLSDRPSVGLRSLGHKAANESKLRAFHALKDLRAGVFSKGQRSSACFLYACILRACAVPMDRALIQVRELAYQCNPTFRDWKSQVRSGYRGMRKPWAVSFAQIADQLQVTPEEAWEISGLTKKAFRPAASFGGESAIIPRKVNHSETRDAKMEQRRVEIRTVVDSLGCAPPYRKMVSILSHRGIEVGHITVRSDYLAMKLESKRVRNSKTAELEDSRQNQLALT